MGSFIWNEKFSVSALPSSRDIVCVGFWFVVVKFSIIAKSSSSKKSVSWKFLVVKFLFLI